MGLPGCDSRRCISRWRALPLVAAMMSTIPESSLCAQPAAPVFERIGRIDHPPVREPSGLVASRQHPGVFWTICDSGNLPQLFAIDRSGKLLAEYDVAKTVNVDWESIAVDDQGNLCIGDIGNNGALLPLRWVLKLREPNPHEDAAGPAGRTGTRSLPVEKTLSYRFPGTVFDAEATFVRGGSIYVLSKTQARTGLYRLPLAGVTEPQTLQKICDVPAINIVTGADISADGRRVALCSCREVVVFELGEDGVEALAGEPKQRIPFRAPEVEGCAWDGDDILLVSEDRSLYRVRLPR
jgi:hypothetical protein